MSLLEPFPVLPSRDWDTKNSTLPASSANTAKTANTTAAMRPLLFFVCPAA